MNQLNSFEIQNIIKIYACSEWKYFYNKVALAE